MKLVSRYVYDGKLAWGWLVGCVVCNYSRCPSRRKTGRVLYGRYGHFPVVRLLNIFSENS